MLFLSIAGCTRALLFVLDQPFQHCARLLDPESDLCQYPAMRLGPAAVAVHFQGGFALSEVGLVGMHADVCDE